MNRLDSFAQNLRRECTRFPSIADVCRQADINRQQFNKYLAGKALPSAAVLNKICKTLNVSQSALLEPQPLAVMSGGTSAFETAALALREVSGCSIDKLQFFAPDFPEGDYFCYFPLPKVPGMLIRSFFRIRRNGSQTGFVRLTAYSTNGRHATKIVRGRHSGIVLASQADFYFVALNRYPPFQLSFMSTARASGSGPSFYSGNAVTKNGGVTITSKFCLMRRHATESLKTSLRSLGIIHEKEAGTEFLVMSSMLAKE
jgi:transcriptional regulator with XRE-family HTH domain